MFGATQPSPFWVGRCQWLFRLKKWALFQGGQDLAELYTGIASHRTLWWRPWWPWLIRTPWLCLKMAYPQFFIEFRTVELHLPRAVANLVAPCGHEAVKQWPRISWRSSVFSSRTSKHFSDFQTSQCLSRILQGSFRLFDRTKQLDKICQHQKATKVKVRTMEINQCMKSTEHHWRPWSSFLARASRSQGYSDWRWSLSSFADHCEILKPNKMNTWNSAWNHLK